MKIPVKKIILAKSLATMFSAKDSFLDWSNVSVVEAASNDEILSICGNGPVDLIVTSLDMPGMECETFFNNVRADPKMQKVSLILVIQDTLAHRERSKHCKTNAVFTMPVDEHALRSKIQQLISIAPRMAYRATMAVAVEEKFRRQPRPFWTENISESGMLIKTEELLDKGTGVFLSFFLHDGTHVTGYGEIVRAQRLPKGPETYLYGIKFTNIDEEARKAIRTVVWRKRKSNYRG